MMEPSMHTSHPEGEIRVELYERRELPPPAQEQADGVYAQLERLAEAEGLSTVTREDWVKRTPVNECDDDLRDTYLTFTHWASESDVHLSPFFQTRECFSPAESKFTDWLVFPAVCLAVYEGDSLSAVYPHTDGSETLTVHDGIDVLSNDGRHPLSPAPTLAD